MLVPFRLIVSGKLVDAHATQRAAWGAKQRGWTDAEDRWQIRRARRSHANCLNLTAGGGASIVRQALPTPVQERSCLLDTPSTGEQSRERLFTLPDALLDERDGAGVRMPNRRLIHRYS